MKPLKRKIKGSAIVISLVMVLIASVAIAGIVGYVQASHRVNELGLARERALAAAEAGLYQIGHYFNKTSDIPGDLASEKAAIDNFFAGGMNPAAIQASGLKFIDKAHNRHSDLISFGSGSTAASVTKLEVTDLPAGTPAWITGLSTAPVFLFTSEAEATTHFGGTAKRVAYWYVHFRSTPSMGVPAGIISGGSVSAHGHFNLRWGEAWSKRDLWLLIKRSSSSGAPLWNWTYSNPGGKAVNLGTPDKWIGYRSATDYIYDSSGDKLSGSSAIYDVGAHNTSDANWNGILWQFEDNRLAALGEQTLSQKIQAVFDQYGKTGDAQKGYSFWKAAAIARGTYYQVRAGGVYNSTGQKIFNSASEAFANYRTVPDAYVAFFDTSDGLPPNAAGTNWVNLSFSGSITNCSKGLLYFCGNLNLTGAGSPPSIHVENPDEVQAGGKPGTGTGTLKVWHNGVVYTKGSYSAAGNGVIYGALVTEGVYTNGGTPDVWYNAALKNGNPQPVSNPTAIDVRLVDSLAQ